MIKRIEAYRYRCFRNLNTRMLPFQVLVGPNGAGKTTLLDIPVLIGEMLKSRSIEYAFQQQTETHPRPRTDYARDLIFNQKGETFELALEAEIPQQIVSSLVEKVVQGKKPKAAEQYRNKPERWPASIRYEIRVELFNEALQIGEENILLLPGNDSKVPRGTGISVAEWAREHSSTAMPVIPVMERRRGDPIAFIPEMEKKSLPHFEFKPTEPAFANLFSDASMFGASLWLRDLLMKDACPYQPVLENLRRAQPPVRRPTLEKDASSLPWLIQDLKTSNPRGFERWIRMVQLAIPQIRDIETVVREDDKHAFLRVIYANDRKVPASGLSDGTLSVLATTVLPYLPLTPLLIMHEEPEHGIHPKGIEVILQSLKAVHAGQVWISSHSPVVLANCEPEELLCLSLDEEEASIALPGGQHPALQEWRRSLDLGTLFAAGVLG
jgi:energy-coupling factor transporter ATP-binding protein EcfA2